MYENTFKAALAAKQQQIGLWLSLANAYSAELCATAGFDWLLLDGEHAPNDLRGTLEQLQAVAPYRSHPIVRPVTGDPALIKQLLDIGAQTILVPMVDDAGQARRMVSAMRYPPEGIRGVGSGVARVSRWGQRADYLDVANDEVPERRGLPQIRAVAVCARQAADREAEFEGTAQERLMSKQ